MLVVGIDEVGRGCLSGDCWACAVAFPNNAVPDGLKDSKALSENRRLALAAIIRETAIIGIGRATVEEIDTINILNATMLAMRRAYDALPAGHYRVLVDGNRLPDLGNVEAEAIIKGDALHPQISAASIIAKVSRDAYMDELHTAHPQYDWKSNKGYGTAKHLAALAAFGPTPHHRLTFAPLSQPALPL